MHSGKGLTLAHYKPTDRFEEESQLSDNQVVQEEVENEEVLHQSEEVVEDVIEDTEIPFDIDEDDDAVLGSLLVPISPIEYKAENPIVDTDDLVKYTDPAGNTFEAPIVVDIIDLNETTKQAVVVQETFEDNDEEIFAEEDNFDLDFNDDTNEDPDSIPDFF
jgi:hypothetical protein